MKFEFNEKNHRYTLDGKPLTGVTTVLGVVAKPALIQWAANQAVDYAKEHIGKVEKPDMEKMKSHLDIAMYFAGELERILEEARKAHITKRDKAAEQGTDVHAECEKYVNDCIEKNNGRAAVLTHENKQVEHFATWAVKNNVKFLESEKKVYDAELWLAGTADLVLEMNGKTYIGDIKTTSGIYGLEPFMQCAAYAKMLDYDIDGTIIINLKKDGSFNEEKDIYFRYDLTGDWEAFEHALGLYRKLNTWKKSYAKTAASS